MATRQSTTTSKTPARTGGAHAPAAPKPGAHTPKPSGQVAKQTAPAKKAAEKRSGQIRWTYPGNNRAERAGKPQSGKRGDHTYEILGAGDAWTLRHTYKGGKPETLAEGVSKQVAYKKAVDHNAKTVAAEKQTAA